MSETIELRYADMPWGRELDEVVAQEGGLNVHVEDLGQGVAIILSTDQPQRHVNVNAHLAPLPRALWWEEIREAWDQRQWPCFWRVKLTLVDDYSPTHPHP